jgi:hypothetical protein
MLSFKLRMVSWKLKDLYVLGIVYVLIFIVFPRNVSLSNICMWFMEYILLQTDSDISISWVNSHSIMYWTIKSEYATENLLSSFTTRCTYRMAHKVFNHLNVPKIYISHQNITNYLHTEEQCQYNSHFVFISSRQVKVKCILVQAMRLCTGCTAHRESRGITLPFHDHGTRRGWDLNPRSQQASGLWLLALWDLGFESQRGHGYLSVVIVVCCQVQVSATSWSLVQRSPTDCGASLCVI